MTVVQRSNRRTCFFSPITLLVPVPHCPDSCPTLHNDINYVHEYFLVSAKCGQCAKALIIITIGKIVKALCGFLRLPSSKNENCHKIVITSCVSVTLQLEYSWNIGYGSDNNNDKDDTNLYGNLKNTYIYLHIYKVHSCMNAPILICFCERCTNSIENLSS